MLTQSRALAALAVAGSHALFLYHTGTELPPYFPLWLMPDNHANRLLLAVLNGRVAVLYFFVLSGFVLGLSQEKKPSTYFAFITRRLARLAPINALVITCICLISAMFPAIAAFHHPLFVGQSFSTTLHNVALNLLMLDSKVNGVTWTLPWELLASFYILPLVAFFKRAGLGLSISLIMLLVGLDIAKAPLFNIFTYAYAFALGSFLAVHARGFRPYGWPWFLVLACGVDLCLSGTASNTSQHVIRLVQTLCVGGVVLGLYHRSPVGGRVGQALSRVGEAAYPFYLAHRYILHLCAIGWLVVVGGKVNPSVAQLMVFALSIGVTLPFALWLHTHVEGPILAFTKKHTQKQSPCV